MDSIQLRAEDGQGETLYEIGIGGNHFILVFLIII